MRPPPRRREHLSGAILFRETLSQVADDGVSFVDHLRRQGIVPGVKVKLNDLHQRLSSATTR